MFLLEQNQHKTSYQENYFLIELVTFLKSFIKRFMHKSTPNAIQAKENKRSHSTTNKCSREHWLKTSILPEYWLALCSFLSY